MPEIKTATSELLKSELLKLAIPNNKIIDYFIDSQSDGSIINCIIENKTVIGFCSLIHTDNSIMTFIHSDYQNKGFGHQLKLHTIKEAFRNPKIENINATAMIGRPGSKGLKKLGFTEIRRTDREIFFELKKPNFKNE
jgi:RimJ/RimL family protein N-acetyltransferase